MSRFMRSLGLFSVAIVSALLVLVSNGRSTQAQAMPQVYPTGTLMVVNSQADGNVLDAYLTLREAILIARSELATSPADCLTNAERARVFSTTWWPADPGAGDCNYITGVGGAGYADVISFHTSVSMVTVTSSLPMVDCGDAIRSNPFDLVRRVTIDGTSAGNGVSGLTLSCGAQSDIQIGHVTIQNFNGAGIYAQGLMTATLTGLDLHGNGTDGIYLGFTGAHNSRGNQIGSANANDRNYIYGNGWNGIEIEGNRAVDSAAMSNHIENNWIGVGTAGNVDLGNTFNGVYLHNAWQNVIGGGTDKRNVISGNGYDGIKIEGDAYAGNFVSYNYIGADANGALPIGNAGSGVALVGGTGNNIIGSGNAIASNTWGVFINSNDNTVIGNSIGTNAASATGLGNSVAGVHLNSGASGNQIGGTPSGWGNVISGNSGPGIVIDNAAANIVELNRIGTNVAGTAALPNLIGVSIQNGASGNYIGSLGPTFSNLISGNSGNGIVIDGAATHNNEVHGNGIGANLAITAALPNTGNGITIQNSAYSNTIGAAGHGNWISGNAHDGVQIVGSGTNGNQVYSNTIGLTVNATAKLGNGWSGVAVFGGASTNTIGAAGAGNVIAGNDVGVYLADGGTHGNVVSYNTIGTNGASASGLGNTNPGVGIFYGATANLVTANLISGNGGPGVDVASSGTTTNTLQGNIIGLNATGTAALPNHIGVSIRNGAANTTIGTAGGGRNLISGNIGDGISVNSSFTTTIANNLIGLSSSGLAAIPNTGNGIGLYLASNTLLGGVGAQYISGNGQNGIYVLVSSRTIVNDGDYIGFATNNTSPLGNGWSGVMLGGATQSWVGGYIGYNGRAGVTVVNTTPAHSPSASTPDGSSDVAANIADQNQIVPLSNHHNLGIPIDLGNDGFTLNDPGDGDTGPNGLLNYPVITATSGTIITGTTCANCKVFAYQAMGNPIANGGGANWGYYSGIANASGVWTITLGGGLLPTNVTLQTCEAPCGTYANTSELSPLYHAPSKVYLPLILNNYSSPITPLTLPEAPAQLGAVTASTTNINLTWSDKSSNEDGFKIELATGVGSTTFGQNKVVGANVTNTIVTGLTPGTTYTFRVRAYNSIGNSGYSNLADAVTTATGAVPAAPDGLIVSTLNPSAPLTDSLGLNWTDNSTNETAFVVESSRDGVTWNLEGSVAANTVAADINGLLENTFYCFRMRAHNANGDSTPTGPACGSTPTTHPPHAPTSLSLQVISSTTLLLTWVNPDDNDGYHLYQSDNGGAYGLIGTWNQGNLLGGYIEGVPGHSYAYKIRAYNTHGESPDSAPSNTVQMPAPAGNTLTRFVDNAAYPIVSLQIDGVEQFPVEPQGVPPSGTFEKQLAIGQHTYRAATGFWSYGSRVEMYVYNGTFNQQANVVGTITLNNPSLGQILTRFSNSGYYVGEFWSGTNLNSKAFRFYSNGPCGYYLNGVLQGGACSTSLISYLGNFIVQFNVIYSQGTFAAYMDERTGSFSLRNGPADWPVINYSYDGH